MFLKSLKISQESICVGVFFNRVAGRQNCNINKKILQHRFFPMNFVNCSRTLILQKIYERLVLKHQSAFLGTPFIYRTSPVAPSDSFRFPACSFIKRENPTQTCFVKFAKFLRIYFDRAPPLDWILCLSVNFQKLSRSRLIQSTAGKLLILCTSQRISTTRYSKKVFLKCFSSILYKNKKQLFEGVHLLKIP